MKPHGLRTRYWPAMLGGVLVGAVLLATPLFAGPLVVSTALDSTHAGTQESNLGDLVADAVRDGGQGDLALLPATELRSVVLPAGKVDSQQLVDSLRAASDASDTVVLLHLTGAQIKTALNHALSRLPAPYAGYLQVSGIHVIYASGPHGAQVSSVVVNGSADPISDDQTYTVATSRLLADGALGYFQVWSKGDVARDTGIPLAKALTDYATAHQPLDYHVEGRIRSR